MVVVPPTRQAIANVLWAAGTSGTALGPALTQGVVDALQRRGDDTHANALALWACTHLKHDPGKDFMATALRAAAAAAQALRCARRRGEHATCAQGRQL